MLFLLLAVTCSLGIGMIFKWTERRGWDRIALLTVNYLVAFLMALAFLAGEGVLDTVAHAPSVGLVAFGVLLGALFIGGFFLLALATNVAGMGMAIAAMRVSVVIPFLASWVLWNERPNALNLAGLALALFAFVLIARRGKAREGETTAPAGKRAAVLLALFVVGGLVDTCLKAFDQMFASTSSRPQFLLFVFGVAFLLGLVVVVGRGLRQGTWPRRSVYAVGVGLGVINYASADFILRAVSQLSGTFVFPANNVAIVVGAALLGVWVWHEKLTPLNWLGVGLAALALVLLRG